MLRLQIMDDRARIGQQEPRIVHRRHLAERRGSPESWVGIADRDALQFEPDPLLAQIAEQFPYERRPYRSIDYHHPFPLRTGRVTSQNTVRSAKLRVGNVCVSTCRSRWSTINNNKTHKHSIKLY